MPKNGFKSITVSGPVYDGLFDVYSKNKKVLARNGIRSFSGYMTSCVETFLKTTDLDGKHTPVLELTHADKDVILVKDNGKNRIAELRFDNNGSTTLRCFLCTSSKCIHCGFACGIYEVKKIIAEKKV